MSVIKVDYGEVGSGIDWCTKNEYILVDNDGTQNPRVQKIPYVNGTTSISFIQYDNLIFNVKDYSYFKCVSKIGVSCFGITPDAIEYVGGMETTNTDISKYDYLMFYRNASTNSATLIFS